MATEWQRRNLERLLGEFRAFRDGLPSTWASLPARYADDYERIVQDLGRQSIDTTGLALPPGSVTASQRETNAITHERAWTDPQVPRAVLVQKVGGAIAYIESILTKGQSPSSAVPYAGTAPITISGSTVNLGTIHGDMRTSIQIIEGRGQAELAQFLADLRKRITTAQLSEPEKDEATQLTETLAREVADHPPGRISAAVRAIAPILGAIVTRSAELAQIWQLIEPHLK